MNHADAASETDPATELMIDGRYICRDLQITDRCRRNYRARGILPEPDTNLNGRDLWTITSYRRFKERLLAGEYAKRGRRPPRMRSAATAA